MARLRPVHAEICQNHRRRTSDQSDEGARSQALARRARRRSVAAHAGERQSRQSAKRTACARSGGSDSAITAPGAAARLAWRAARRRAVAQSEVTLEIAQAHDSFGPTF